MLLNLMFIPFLIVDDVNVVNFVEVYLDAVVIVIVDFVDVVVCVDPAV